MHACSILSNAIVFLLSTASLSILPHLLLFHPNTHVLLFHPVTRTSAPSFQSCHINSCSTISHTLLSHPVICTLVPSCHIHFWSILSHAFLFHPVTCTPVPWSLVLSCHIYPCSILLHNLLFHCADASSLLSRCCNRMLVLLHTLPLFSSLWLFHPVQGVILYVIYPPPSCLSLLSSCMRNPVDSHNTIMSLNITHIS
jgi:hypothetical protein